MISELTYKIVAFSEVPNFNSDDCVDWAIEMLTLGYESESLLILSSFSKPTNHFEIVSCLKNTLAELNLEEKKGEEAIISYSSYYIWKIANSVDIRNNLEMIYKFCQLKDYEGIIYDFYLLYWAWDQLDYDDSNHYWEGANKSNIESIVKEVAVEWLNKNKKHYAQQCVKNMPG